MPHSFGYRARTRDLFSRKFRKSGAPPMSAFGKLVKVGDYVDVVANSAVVKGMPHKFYHGRTGVVFNVTRRAIGVEVNKQVRNRIIKKRIHVRAEHVRISKCRQKFVERVKRVDALKRAAKDRGESVPIEQIKRFPVAPRLGAMIQGTTSDGRKPVLIKPAAFDDML